MPLRILIKDGVGDGIENAVQETEMVEKRFLGFFHRERIHLAGGVMPDKLKRCLKHLFHFPADHEAFHGFVEKENPVLRAMILPYGERRN